MSEKTKIVRAVDFGRLEPVVIEIDVSKIPPLDAATRKAMYEQMDIGDLGDLTITNFEKKK